MLEILERLYFIERGYLNANHFVYAGAQPVLVDTGYISDFPETERLINETGVDLKTVALIINTHCHCDHIGGNQLIQRQSGCDIALHKIGRHFIEKRDDWSLWWRYYQQDAAFFQCTLELNDASVVAIGPHLFQVMYTPGHASDGIVLYHPEEKILISSDALWEFDMAVITERIEGSRALFCVEQSLDKIEALDVAVVYPGHGKPFTDMHAAIQKTRNRIQRFKDDKTLIGKDVLKKITVYTLLIQQRFHTDQFYDFLMRTHWFTETIDLYFRQDYRSKYDEIIAELLQRGILKIDDDHFLTTIKP
jgi:glyoxylase-like metal-dependent hydrolase (beta-lactamase superfamily II)